MLRLSLPVRVAPLQSSLFSTTMQYYDINTINVNRQYDTFTDYMTHSTIQITTQKKPVILMTTSF